MMTKSEKVLYERVIEKMKGAGMKYTQIREGTPCKTPRGSTRKLIVSMWGDSEKHWASVTIESILPEDMAFVTKVSTEVDEWKPGSFRDWSEII
jgi:hypothetical protein